MHDCNFSCERSDALCFAEGTGELWDVVDLESVCVANAWSGLKKVQICEALCYIRVIT